MRRAVFLDRDGTLIREVGYLRRLADLELLPGAAGALRILADAGYVRIVITNQSGIARGFFDLAFVEETHRELRLRLREAGADVEAFYVCPHHPELTGPCRCRKPAPGLVEQGAREWGVDLGASWTVGDKPADVELARNAGCRAALVRSGYGRETEMELTGRGVVPDLVADDLEVLAKRLVDS